MKIAAALCVLLSVAMTCEHKAIFKDEESRLKPAHAGCFYGNQLPKALRDLASGKPSRVDRARAAFLEKSKPSTSCRTEVITVLMMAMDKPDLDFNRDTSSYYLWLYGADILGELQATEALDLLVSHLNLHSAISLSMNDTPAILGVIKMGSIAIPKLSEVLTNPKLRYAAIYAIASIGGSSAITALKAALVRETDECTKRLITVTLDSFDENGIIKNTAQWFGRFKCK